MRHYCPLSNYKPHPPKNKLFFIFYCIFELKFPHKKSKKQIEAADNKAAGTVSKHVVTLKKVFFSEYLSTFWKMFCTSTEFQRRAQKILFIFLQLYHG